MQIARFSVHQRIIDFFLHPFFNACQTTQTPYKLWLLLANQNRIDYQS